MEKKLLLTYIVVLFTAQAVFSQPLTNHVYQHKIKTVQCHKYGWPLSYPIISLGGADQLMLSFDDLYGETRDFYYSIIHCDENWEPSQLMETEYIKGINEIPLLDYQYSFNTSVDYVNYTLVFPNEDCELLVSGNYILKVYEDGDIENVVLTQRFMVTEQRVAIYPEVKFTMNTEIRKAQQEIDLVIKHPDFNIQNPLEEISVSIFQNGREDNGITRLKPQFIRDQELDYNYNREVLFEGGNEFRWLDIRSLRFKSSKVKEVSFHDPYAHVELFPDDIMAGGSYYFNNDFNGKYVIEVQERDENEREADYVYVHFSLPREEPVVGGGIYVLGGLTNWQYARTSKMKYNFNAKQYEVSLLLKQGFYNYQFAFKANNSDRASVSMFEGSHSRTENDYLILVYYRGVGDYYDRLIGVGQVNSVQR